MTTIDHSRPDPGESAKDIATRGPGLARHRRFERRELAVPEFAVKHEKQAQVARLFQLLRGGNTAALARQGQAMHILKLLGQADSAMVDAAYAPYRAEVSKVMGAYAGVGGVGYGAYKLHEASKPKPRMTRALAALGIDV